MSERSALEQHPELAQLWTLHYAGRMALKSLEYSRTIGVPLLVRPAVSELRSSIEKLLVAVERYKSVVQIPRTEEIRVYIPESWPPELADAAMTVLCDLADKVWRARQAEYSMRSRSRSTRALCSWSDRNCMASRTEDGGRKGGRVTTCSWCAAPGTAKFVSRPRRPHVAERNPIRVAEPGLRLQVPARRHRPDGLAI